MGEIHVLSKDVSELIAAGEVIERPASVIKELMENAIDAGATNITVEIKNGGRTYMRVTDNGSGIYPDDVPTAFLRHATSKILNGSDLDAIFTLGFRGEALASISAVSRTEIITKKKRSDYGVHYCLEASEVVEHEETGCPDGTTVIVRDLFYNVPARLKFLKKDVSEGNSIANMVSKIALSKPEISFKFIRDNRPELVTPGDGKPLSAVYSVMGKAFAGSVLPVDYSLSGVKVSGFVTKPLMSRANRSFQNFFVNSRYVKSVTCMVALEEAYRNSIMVGKFPGCVLYLEIDPACLDVNVHPAKLEIRFSDEKPVYDAVYFAVKNALMIGDGTMEAEISEKPASAFPKPLTLEEIYHKPTSDEVAVQLRFGSSPSGENASLPQNTGDPEDKPEKPNPYLGNVKLTKETGGTQTSENARALQNFEPAPTPQKTEPKPDVPEPPAASQPTDEPEERSFRLIGELFKTYAVVESGEEMYLVDKHAAHERYNFDRLKKGLSRVDIQVLAFPFDVTLSYEEFTAVKENEELFRKFGFELQPLEPPVVKLYGVPLLLTDEEPTDLLVSFAERISKGDSDGSELFDELLHSVACKASIRANSFSRPEELEKIFGLVIENKLLYCPHGRPTAVKFTKREIEKLFKRIV